jgi:hypothetical protein
MTECSSTGITFPFIKSTEKGVTVISKYFDLCDDSWEKLLQNLGISLGAA